MRVNPECRACGARVEYFGDTCPECPEGTDGITAITAADLARLSERGDA